MMSHFKLVLRSNFIYLKWSTYESGIHNKVFLQAFVSPYFSLARSVSANDRLDWDLWVTVF